MERTGALSSGDPITRRRFPVPESIRVAPEPKIQEDLPCITITAAYRLVVVAVMAVTRGHSHVSEYEKEKGYHRCSIELQLCGIDAKLKLTLTNCYSCYVAKLACNLNAKIAIILLRSAVSGRRALIWIT